MGRLPTALLVIVSIAAVFIAACGSPADDPAVQGHRIVIAGQEVDFEMQLMLILAAAEIYRIHTGTYPSTENGLNSLVAEPEIVDGSGIWRGPYIDNPEVFKDPWGRALVYELNPDKTITLKSLGADGAPGEDDLDAKELFPDWYKEIHALANMPAPALPTPPDFSKP